jgi:hypothetical protein
VILHLRDLEDTWNWSFCSISNFMLHLLV